MGFSINYIKHSNRSFFQSVNNSPFMDVSGLQNYVPIYSRFFSLNDTNFNHITLNHKYRILSIGEPNKFGGFKCTLDFNEPSDYKNKINSNVFFKYGPLIDPFKYTVGKYDGLQDNNEDIHNKTVDGLLTVPSLSSSDTDHFLCNKKLLEVNNSTYIDGFFTYLTSMLLHHHWFLPGLDYYGSFLCKQKIFKINVADELEYLYSSDYFQTKKGELFDVEKNVADTFMNMLSRSCKKRLNVSNNSNSSTIDLDVCSIESFGDVFKSTGENNGENKENNGENNENITELSCIELDDITLAVDGSNRVITDEISVVNEDIAREIAISKNDKHRNNSKNNTTNHSSSTCSSRSSNTDNDGSGYESEVSSSGDDTDKGTDDDSENGSDDDDVCINAFIYNFPIQIIAMEQCEGTLDSLMTDEDLSEAEWGSILIQIIMMLITYQRAFNFTHNDLHSNNIMYKTTEREFLYYKINGKYWKVPTYGRIFKIIDFGRAIYSFNGKRFCSDSFFTDGDAYSQYNCEPFFDEKKPRIDPNYSFDLCRFGCTLYDYFVDDDDTIDTVEDQIVRLIIEWCMDDKGRNILYKKNGAERYPDFKLYKMIARTVHNHTPERQLERELFKTYCISKKQMGKRTKFMDIDNMPSYN
jgi:hypothetical protein